MNSHHVKGAINEAKGKAKENIGYRLGNDNLASKGLFDRVKGKIQKGIGDLKQVVKRNVDNMLDEK